MLYQRVVKRMLSVVFSTAGLVLASPAMLAVAFAVRIRLGTPVIFRQKRPGLHEKIFSMYKFRTMTDARDADGKLLPDRDRQTGLGRFLRKTSLDELPELWNVLKGDMCFIGPRPLLTEYLPLYTDRQHLRHGVRPGMANLSAIKGRNCLEWKERLEMDAWYAEHVSFRLDLRIALKTVETVLLRKGCPDTLETTRSAFTQPTDSEVAHEYP